VIGKSVTELSQQLDSLCFIKQWTVGHFVQPL